MVKLIHNNLAIHLLNKIRDKNTRSEKMRRLLREITKIVISELMRDKEQLEEEIETWIGKYRFKFIEEKKIVFIAILRAGLPMLESALELLEEAKAGFIGAKRDENTLETDIYYVRLPDISGKEVIILDPMLATGGTLKSAINMLKELKPNSINSIHLVSSPEALKTFEDIDTNIFILSVDEKLNNKGFIIPGLGDMGDRLYS